MELTLKNYTTALPKDLQRQAAKTVVRECDETAKGHFVAYVDEGGESFDVSLDIAAGGQLKAHSCDCRQGGGFCRHKTALLLHVVQGKKTKPTGAAKKKASRAEALLEEADPDELKVWVRELLLKNKDLELAFVQHFAAGKQSYSPAEVIQLTNDAIKAVAGNKKTIDLTQLKKLVELWTGIHTPIVEVYKANLASDQAFQGFHALLESCISFQYKINTNSNRIPKYIEGLLQQTVESLNELYSEEAWNKAVGYYIQHLSDGRMGVRVHYLLHLKNLGAISSDERRKALMERLGVHYRKHNPDQYYNGDLYTKMLFGMVKEYGFFAEYSDLFKPIHFDNEFNERLIRQVMEAGHMDRAERYCREQIQGNYREQYDLPYLELLREIYTRQNDEKNLLDIVGRLFPHTYRFEDYLVLYGRMPDSEEKKKWRTWILKRARSASQNRHPEALEFLFRLMDHEQSYRKMVEYLDTYTPYRLILRYIDPMARAAKDRLLPALLRKTEDWGFYDGAEKDGAAFPALLDALLRHYTLREIREELQKEEKNRYFFSCSGFIEYLKKHLSATAT